MGGDHLERTERRIRVQTANATVEGTLRVATILRTLDDLNLDGKKFVSLFEPEAVGTTWNFDPGELAINRTSILFVQELSNPPRHKKQFAGVYSRTSIKLRVGEHHIEGFLHVPPGGDCLKRLSQNNHPFVSLTSVSVVGPDTQFATPFLAVNREHILMAQEIFHDDGTTDELEMSFEVTT